MLADETSAKYKLNELLKAVDKKDEAETYYLVSLALRGLGLLQFLLVILCRFAI